MAAGHLNVHIRGEVKHLSTHSQQRCLSIHSRLIQQSWYNQLNTQLITIVFQFNIPSVPNNANV